MVSQRQNDFNQCQVEWKWKREVSKDRKAQSGLELEERWCSDPTHGLEVCQRVCVALPRLLGVRIRLSNASEL